MLKKPFPTDISGCRLFPNQFPYINNKPKAVWAAHKNDPVVRGMREAGRKVDPVARGSPKAQRAKGAKKKQAVKQVFFSASRSLVLVPNDFFREGRHGGCEIILVQLFNEAISFDQILCVVRSD